MICEEHLGERRHPDQKVQHGAAVGVVGAVVVRLHRRHGVVLAYALPVLLLQVLHSKKKQTNKPVLTCFISPTFSALKEGTFRMGLTL